MRYVNQKRLIIVYIAVMLFAGLIFFRLYTIAVSDFAQILPALNHQHTRRLNIVERRGFIFDRHGKIIAGHPGLYNSLVDPSKIGLYLNDYGYPETVYDAAEKLSRISANLDSDDILRKIRNGVPFIIQTRESLNNHYVKSYLTHRRAAAGNPAAHIIGYLNRDRQGVTGIEAVYNDFLEKTGARVFAVWDADALGRSFRGMPVSITERGYESMTGITLTLDLELQENIERIADNMLKMGAIVVACTSTGEILSSVSRPVFSLDNLAHYIDSENGEFINRAFSAFTPGSVFKTVIAGAALELDPRFYNWEYYCTGSIDVFGQNFTCHRRWGHGALNMTEAYANSCNTYFMTLALELGYDIIRQTARNLGIGEASFLDGISVSRGNIPSIHNPPPAFTANAAIGQGELLMTPLEAARIFCAVANGGIMPELSLVKSFIFERETSDSRNTSSRRVFSERTAGYLSEMARAVVQTGTGVRAAPEYGAAGGKTSSAESGQFRERENEYGEPVREQIVHSWFSGFYPACPGRVPLYSITVIAEGGVNDNIRSTEIFREIANHLGKRAGIEPR